MPLRKMVGAVVVCMLAAVSVNAASLRRTMPPNNHRLANATFINVEAAGLNARNIGSVTLRECRKGLDCKRSIARARMPMEVSAAGVEECPPPDSVISLMDR